MPDADVGGGEQVDEGHQAGAVAAVGQGACGGELDPRVVVGQEWVHDGGRVALKDGREPPTAATRASVGAAGDGAAEELDVRRPAGRPQGVAGGGEDELLAVKREHVEQGRRGAGSFLRAMVRKQATATDALGLPEARAAITCAARIRISPSSPSSAARAGRRRARRASRSTAAPQAPARRSRGCRVGR